MTMSAAASGAPIGESKKGEELELTPKEKVDHEIDIAIQTELYDRVLTKTRQRIRAQRKTLF